MIGNSSSGLLEVPTFKKFTINVGNRQKGRLRAKSVLDTTTSVQMINKFLKLIYLPSFKKILRKSINPYGKGNANIKILKTRLPRMHTDQTVGITKLKTKDNLLVMLEIVQNMSDS